MSDKSMAPEEAQKLFKQQLTRFNATKKGTNQATFNLFQRSMEIGGGAMLHAAQGLPATEIKTATVTEIIMILDESRSMIGQEVFVLDSANEAIDDLASERNTERQEMFLTVWAFTNSKARLIYSNQRITKARHLTIDDYNPKQGGNTPLHKVMIQAMGGSSLRAEGLRNAQAGHRKVTKTLFVAVSDGLNYDVVSPQKERFTKNEVKTAVNAMLSTERWVITMAYAGNPDDAKSVADSLGIPSVRSVSRERGGWRQFFQLVSRSAKALSAPGSNTGSVQNGFVSS